MLYVKTMVCGVAIKSLETTLILHPARSGVKIGPARSHVACSHDQNKSGFFGGPAFSSQSEIALIGWIKAGPSKKPLLF